ncbi:MAG: iron ABC transporter permease [Pirellulales bacterium]|nr:iron ABC transporter permease [Pirellulales bacterium]
MKKSWIVFGCALFALAVLAAAPFIGMERIPLSALWGGTENDARVGILWKLRIPRVLMAFLAGTALSAGGTSFQALFRNPLATPFTLGVASGASLGATVCFFLGGDFAWWGVPGVTIGALLGALLTVLLVALFAARAPAGATTATMLLAGVALSFFFSSLILFLQYLSDPTQTFRILRWTMGGMANVVGLDEVLLVLPFVVTGCLLVAYLIHELNLLLMGEDFAVSRGVALRGVKRTLYFAVSLMVGAVVAFCGPIGFVGLIVPHVCRLLVGPDHRALLPAALLTGGAFLVVCDTVGRTVLFFTTTAPAEIPVGVITALLGGPFFLWILLGRRSGPGEF